jgi:hypothetical protein
MKPLKPQIRPHRRELGIALVAMLGNFGPAYSSAQAQPFNIDTGSREIVRSFYNRVYQASEGVPIGWTGDIASCNAGTVSPAYQEATRLRVNFFRAMAGLPSNITFSEANNAKAQAAALMMSANKQLNHQPPTSWTCYTQLGSDGAPSNLNMGSTGPKSIDSFMQDGGDNNAEAGHRRWIMVPEQLTMGSGHIPGTSSTDWQSMTAALWVHDTRAQQRPPTREEFEAWPPKGYVPYQIVYPRWSFGISGADVSAATVTIQRAGQSLPIKIDSRSGGNLVFIPNNLNHSASWTRPTADDPHVVTIGNVMVGGTARNYSYTVTIFDPQVPSADYARTAVTGPDRPNLNQDNAYNFSGVPIATGYQWRATKITGANLTDGAENGLANFDAAGGVGNPVNTAVKATGASSFRLHRVSGAAPQTLTLKRTLLAGPASQITFKNRSLSTSSYASTVQVSTDAGASWQTVFTQAGSDTSDAGFTDRMVSLASLANRQFLLRFALENTGGPFYTGDNPGWYIDDITLVNLEEALPNPALNAVAAGTTFNFRPTEAADFVLDVRPQVFGNYFEEWGNSLRVSTSTTVPTAPTIGSQPQSQTVVAGANVAFSVTAQGTAPLSYLWKLNNTDLADGAGVQGSRTATLNLQNVQAAQAGSYTVQISNGAGNVTSTAATLVLGEAPSLATALDTTGLTWTTAGAVGWQVQTATTHDNVDAVQSGKIADSQESTLETVINGPATVAFWWRSDSEQNFDFLSVELDGALQFRISGTIAWEQKTVAVPAGTHTLRWAYRKDTSDSRGADAGWVDQVEIRQAQPPPSLGDALDNNDIRWAAAGDRPWFAQTTTTRDGTDATQSGPIADNQRSTLEATVVGPANLSFWWKVDSEQNYDFLSFELDNAAAASAAPISGSVNWEQKTVPIPAGTHTIRWVYTKDASASSGADAGYVDQVVLTKLTPGEAGEPGPKLEYTLSGTKLRITWPEAAERFKLQSATSITAGNWTDVSENDISKEEGEFFTTVLTSAGTRFYRLVDQ